jgi:quinol monooxygenase YgiN
MLKLSLLARLEAKPGKEAEVAAFLASALPLANAEKGTPVWFAFRIGESTFGVFDAFADETTRQAHLSGAIAQALMAKAEELFSRPPVIEQLDLLAVKLASDRTTPAPTDFA